MIGRRWMRNAVALAALLLMGAPALAHPHLFVTTKSELVYALGGALTGIRHSWTFDESFAAFATQGLDINKTGTWTREELAPIAEVNIASLKEFGFFTVGTADGNRTAFADATDYWFEYNSKDATLTLNFTLPFAAPVRPRDLTLEIFDPMFFIEFSFEGQNPVALAGAPDNCTLSLKSPNAAEMSAQALLLGESFFSEDKAANYGASFANRIAVNCK